MLSKTRDRAVSAVAPVDVPYKETPPARSRIDSLIEIVDLCTAAKQIAETMDDRFLGYMLDMAIQAARTEMRPKVPKDGF